ncbi:MAG: 50S ribosomal protein L29 [Mycoplasmataceae bacterium]|nr:50S ribosomal protein L29 [Mycoplasmataceae bacterium]
MLDMKELRSKSTKELEEIVQNLKEQLFVLRFEKATGQATDTHKFSEIRKDIARAYTAINIVEDKNLDKKSKPSKSKEDTKKQDVKVETKLEKEVVKQEASDKKVNKEEIVKNDSKKESHENKSEIKKEETTGEDK